MPNIELNGRALKSVFVVVFCIGASIWSFLQTRDSVSLVYRPDGTGFMYFFMLYGVSGMIQFGSSSAFSAAHTREERGDHRGALGMTLFGYSLEVVDACTNIAAVVTSQYGGDFLAIFRGPIPLVCLRLFVHYFQCIWMVRVEEHMLEYLADAANAAGESGLAETLMRWTPKGLMGGKKSKGLRTQPAPAVASSYPQNANRPAPPPNARGG